MNTQHLRHGFWLLMMWIYCLQACRAVPQKGASDHEGPVQPSSFEYLKIVANIDYQEDTHHYHSAYISLRIKKDGLIWFTVRVPWGMEVLRGMITPQGITLISHRKKTYYVYDYATLRTLWPSPWDYAMLQALLLGELAHPLTTHKVIQQNAKQIVIQYQQAGWLLTYFINPTCKKVVKLVATATQGSLTASYYPLKFCQEGLPFKQVTLHWHCRTIPTQPSITINLKNIKAYHSDKPLRFPLAMPAQYEKK